MVSLVSPTNAEISSQEDMPHSCILPSQLLPSPDILPSPIGILELVTANIGRGTSGIVDEYNYAGDSFQVAVKKFKRNCDTGLEGERRTYRYLEKKGLERHFPVVTFTDQHVVMLLLQKVQHIWLFQPEETGKETCIIELLKDFQQVLLELLKHDLLYSDLGPGNVMLNCKGDKPFLQLVDLGGVTRKSKKTGFFVHPVLTFPPPELSTSESLESVDTLTASKALTWNIGILALSLKPFKKAWNISVDLSWENDSSTFPDKVKGILDACETAEMFSLKQLLEKTLVIDAEQRVPLETLNL